MIIKINALTAQEFASLSEFLASVANQVPPAQKLKGLDDERFIESENGIRVVLERFCILQSAKSSKDLPSGMDVVLHVATCLAETREFTGIVSGGKGFEDIPARPKRRLTSDPVLKLFHSMRLFI